MRYVKETRSLRAISLLFE